MIPTVLTDPTFLGALVLAVACILAYVLVVILRTDGQDNAEYDGATAEYADELHDMAGPVHADPLTAETSPVYRSRHHDDTVEIVVGEYRPVYSRAFAAAMGGQYTDRAAVR